MFFFKLIGVVLVTLSIAACGDNLFPSAEDKRHTVISGSTGGSVSQKAPDFSVSDTNGAAVTRASALSGKKGAVFYFTMWCPICDSHQSHMRRSIVPLFPEVNFYLVDYVSGSVSGAGSAASASGYNDFVTLADTDKTMLGLFGATMGTTIVIDSAGVIRMNEDYKDGETLRTVLSAMP